jgi:hypothetical protein
MQSSTTDANRDGKPDELRISATMPLASDEVITGATAIAFLDVQLSVGRARLLLRLQDGGLRNSSTCIMWSRGRSVVVL